ncbi:MAG: S4 domain-containing protein YaaA [Caldilineaceae bacterium]|nr:S4 domain-containing protein YaaA [Caldilineaceae bacterium]
MEEYIKLDQFLKLARVVQTGGEAKFLIQSGEVTVNGVEETRRGRKLYHGDLVMIEGEEMLVMMHDVDEEDFDEQDTAEEDEVEQ